MRMAGQQKRRSRKRLSSIRFDDWQHCCKHHRENRSEENSDSGKLNWNFRLFATTLRQYLGPHCRQISAWLCRRTYDRCVVTLYRLNFAQLGSGFLRYEREFRDSSWYFADFNRSINYNTKCEVGRLSNQLQLENFVLFSNIYGCNQHFDVAVLA